jgi:hypothetical protein
MSNPRLLAGSLPLEIEVYPAFLARHAGQLPVLGAERIELALGQQSLGLEVANHLFILPARLERNPRWLDVSVPRLDWPGREGNFNSGSHNPSSN